MKRALFPFLITTSLLSAAAQAAEPHTLTMAGHGEAAAVPDLAQVSVGVTTQAVTAAQALSANSARMKGVFAALEKLGVPQRDIQTVNFSVSPQYTAGTNNEPSRLTGYQVNNDVSVRLRDVAKLGMAVDALVTAGANQMNGISFSISDSAPLLEKARIAAIADAKARAETYAREAGVTLGPILSIRESSGEIRPMMRMAAPATAVAAGEQNVSADVTVVWEIH